MATAVATTVAYWPGNVPRIQSRMSRMKGDDRMTPADDDERKKQPDAGHAGLYHS